MYSWRSLLKNYGSVLRLLSSILFVLILLAELYFLHVYQSDKLWLVITYSLSVMVPPILYLPVLGWISQQVPLFGGWKNVVAHSFFNVIFVLLYILTVQILLMILNGNSFAEINLEYIYNAFIRQFSFSGSIAFLVYWGIVVLYGVQKYEADTIALTERTIAIERQLSRATLSALKAQLKPHFLFNTLSLVDHLIRTAPNKAVDTVSKLEDMLKSTFDKSSLHTCSLAAEVDFLKKYLDIEKARFESRLEIRIQISEETKMLQIPCYLVQPLVENSIKHGVGKSLKTCTITISSHINATEDNLYIEVLDNGTGARKKVGKQDWGIGLKNVEERITLFFGKDARLSASVETQGGFRTSIVIPTKYLPDQ